MICLLNYLFYKFEGVVYIYYLVDLIMIFCLRNGSCEKWYLICIIMYVKKYLRK